MSKTTLHKQLCERLHETYVKKNGDYGDSFAKTREIVPNAILVRLHDKLNRVTALLSGTKQQVNDESVDDTLLDLANYALMELVERQAERPQPRKEADSGMIHAYVPRPSDRGNTIVFTAEITVNNLTRRDRPFDEEELRGLAKAMCKQLNVDDVVITKSQVF